MAEDLQLQRFSWSATSGSPDGHASGDAALARAEVVRQLVAERGRYLAA